jgi:hypothetical protein
MFDQANFTENSSLEEIYKSFEDSSESSATSDFGAYSSDESQKTSDSLPEASRMVSSGDGSEDELITLEVSDILDFVPSMYDPDCFEIIDPKLLSMLSPDCSSEYQRSCVIMYIEVAVTFGIHWTDLIRYVPSDTEEEDPVDIEDFKFDDVEIQYSSSTSKVVFSCFNEVIVEDLNSPDLFEFAADTIVKRLPVPVGYDIHAVGDIIHKNGHHVFLDEENNVLEFFPYWSAIPSDIQAIINALATGYMPQELRKYLFVLALDDSIEFSFGDLAVDLSKIGGHELLPEALGGMFSGARLDLPVVPIPTSVQSWRGESEGGGISSYSELKGYSRFKIDVESLRTEFDPQDYYLDSEDLNELFSEEPIAKAVNGVLTSGKMDFMSKRVTRYLSRVGNFSLVGEDRYIEMFKLLQVSGAFYGLKRKLEESYSYVVAMKVWLHRTAIVVAPYEFELEFVTI